MSPNYYTFKEDENGIKDFSSFYDVTGCGNTVNAQARPTFELNLRFFNPLDKVDAG